MFDLEPTITLPWLRRLRWLFVVGQLVIWAVLHLVFATRVSVWPFVGAVTVIAASNIAIGSRLVRSWSPATIMGVALVLDVVVLTAELSALGGATNPFTVMYLVYITLSAVVLSARWTTAIASLAIVGFALLFAVPSEMHVHHSGPPILDRHLQGMWTAFVLAAVLMGFFVRRISRAIATQREQIASLREAGARNAQLASLATLAAGAAHELNNPLSTIAVAAHEAALRARTIRDAASVATDLDLILDQVDRCQRILHQMSARADADDTNARIGTQQLVDEIRRQLGDGAGRVDIELQRAPGELAVPTAPAVQSVLALLKNALDASAPETRVTLAVRQERDAIAIEIGDRGPGIPADLLLKVGEPFFTTKAPGRGRGLGVFLARVFFESRGGALSIRSTVGVGTVATAHLPLEAT
jgi:two-component system sensor histidine kinase RegB